MTDINISQPVITVNVLVEGGPTLALDVPAAPVVEVVPLGQRGMPGQKGDTGPQGPQGDTGDMGPSGVEAYTHYQVTPSAVWTINHGFPYAPSVTVVDTSGGQWHGAVDNPSAGVTVVSFSAAFAGTAHTI